MNSSLKFRRLKSVLVPVVAIGILAASAGAMAQLAPKPENLIKWRQSAYQVVAWNSGRIKTSLAGKYDKDEVVRAANALAAVANSGLPTLFAPGTEKGKGWRETGAKPELFKEPQHFAELDADFARQATELSKIAATGDAAAIKQQFIKLNGTCKACHDQYKAE